MVGDHGGDRWIARSPWRVVNRHLAARDGVNSFNDVNNQGYFPRAKVQYDVFVSQSQLVDGAGTGVWEAGNGDSGWGLPCYPESRNRYRIRNTVVRTLMGHDR